MSDSILKQTAALREEALRALQSSPEFAAFRALDDAVFAMGGLRRVLGAVREAGEEAKPNLSHIPHKYHPGQPPKRITQPDAAEECLRETGRPMTVGDLIKLVEGKGITFSGTDPVASFGSQLSRNGDRFESRRIDGQSYWWLRGMAWPSSGSEAPDLPLEQGSDASVSHSSQEGGDAHAATIAN
jgi:hypothetical protein